MYAQKQIICTCLILKRRSVKMGGRANIESEGRDRQGLLKRGLEKKTLAEGLNRKPFGLPSGAIVRIHGSNTKMKEGPNTNAPRNEWF